MVKFSGSPAMLGVTTNAAILEATIPPPGLETPRGAVQTFTATAGATPHPLRLFSSNKKRRDFDFSEPDDLTDMFKVYWKDEVASTPCHSPGHPSKTNNCKCKSHGCLDSDSNCLAGAELMLMFAQLNHNCRNNCIIDAVKKADSLKSRVKSQKRMLYWLPGLKKNKNQDVYVCKGTFCHVLGAGKKKMEGVSKWMKANENKPLKGYEHGLIGRESNRAKAAKERACKFLQHLHNTEREERATRFVRTIAGLTTRDDNPDISELPSHMSKRRCWGRHCYKQGYVIKVDDKGNFGSMSNYTVRSALAGPPFQWCRGEAFAPSGRRSFQKVHQAALPGCLRRLRVPQKRCSSKTRFV